MDMVTCISQFSGLAVRIKCKLGDLRSQLSGIASWIKGNVRKSGCWASGAGRR